MTDLVKCDRCGTPFSIQTAGIRATWSGDYMVQYFTCPGCHHRYQILTTDTELRQTIQRHTALNQPVIIPSMSAGYLIRMACRACTEPIGVDVIGAMSIRDYNTIRTKARNFLLRSDL